MDLGLGRNGRIETGPSAGDEHVDVGSERRAGVDEPIPQPRDPDVERVDHLGDGRAVDLDEARRVGKERNEGAGKMDGRAHAAPLTR